jgi:hypothetical protein
MLPSKIDLVVFDKIQRIGVYNSPHCSRLVDQRHVVIQGGHL